VPCITLYALFFVSVRDKLHTVIESGVYSIFVTGRRTFSQVWFIFALFSPYIGAMFQAPEGRSWDYVICCKQCRRNIPAPVETMPDQYFVAKCPLCGAKRNYRPTELFQGRLSYELIRGRSV
jgi:hypothetical protein